MKKYVLSGLCLVWAFGAAAEIKPWSTEHEAPVHLRALIPATPTFSWAKGWWKGRHEAKVKEAQAGGADIVFIGDSITHGWESHGKDVWARYFSRGKYRALNLGFSGDRTEHVLWRIANGELDGYKAKAIVLMLGTNNSGHFPIAEETPIDTIVGMKAVLAAIRAKQPQAKIMLCAIFPRGADNQDAYRKRNNAVNKELSKFTDGVNIFWLDFTERFLTADGRLSLEIMPDRLHPQKLGYEIWASEILPYLTWALDPQGRFMPQRYAANVNPAQFSTGGPETVNPVSAFPNYNWWGTRAAEKRAEIAAHTNRFYDMVFVGDSITHRFERPGGGGEKVWAQLRQTYSILNLGYGGDRTQHVLWRLENGELEGYQTKLFMLMIGTNNARDAAPDVAAGVKACIATLRRKHPEAKVLLLPIFPRGKTAQDKLRVKNNAVNAIIKGYADGKDVLWLDFNDRFLDKEGNILPGLMFADNLHPDNGGYEIWRDAALPVFRQIVGK